MVHMLWCNYTACVKYKTTRDDFKNKQREREREKVRERERERERERFKDKLKCVYIAHVLWNAFTNG